MYNLKIFLPLLFLGLALLLQAQQTTVYTDAQLAYKKGNLLFEQAVYGKAMESYQEALDMLKPAQSAEIEMLRMKAELGYARSAVRLELPESEKLILEFYRRYHPDPVAGQALKEVANYYYNDRKYDKAINYFLLIPSTQLNRKEAAEVNFKVGYSHFVKRRYEQARPFLQQVQRVENEYYYPTNYYLGLCEFFLGNYEDAIRSFRIAEKYRRYQRYVPYYIAQIYFAQGRYNELLTYVEPKLNEDNVRNNKELRQLVGQAYFERENFEKALEHLEYFAMGSRLSPEQSYQLAYTQYKTGHYDRAVENFEEVAYLESELGQYASYYMADALLKLNNKNSARNAFGKAGRLTFDPYITEEATFNFAKLSYELGYDRDAITALQSISRESRYYQDAQQLMSEVFQNTQDYERALSIIENIPNRTPQLREAYQKVAYYQGLKLYRNGQYTQAKTFFNKSNTEPIDATIKAACIYWLGDIAHLEKDYNSSIRLLGQFLTLARSLQDLPDESSLHTANYTMGYNYLKQEKYTNALGYFQDAVAGINRNRPFIQSRMVKEEVLGDATLRTGDCYFKRNQYQDAVRFYDEAIQNKYGEYVYALYQKAIIKGLQGATTEKILALEDIVEKYPRSGFADDAYYSLGITYQEIGQLNRAISPFKQLIANYRNSSDLLVKSLLRLGLVHFNLGDLQTSAEYYKKVFENNPEPDEAKDALDALEEIYVENLGDPDAYTRFLETVPGYGLDDDGKDALNFKAAESQYENANYDRAIAGFSDYLRKYPNGQNVLLAHYHRALSYFELKRYGEALSDFEYVVNKGPSRYYAKSLELAALISYNFTQDFQKAYQLYSKLESAAPTEEIRFEAQVGALQSAYRLNNTDAVYEMASKVINNPSAAIAQKATANFYLGKVALDTKDYDAALNAFQRVAQVSNDEEAAEARYLIAQIYYQRRELARAEQYANQAIQANTAYPYWVAKSMILLADTLADMGDLFNAGAVLEALLDGYDGDQTLINEARAKKAQYDQQANEGSRLNRSAGEGGLEFDDGN